MGAARARNDRETGAEELVCGDEVYAATENGLKSGGCENA